MKSVDGPANHRHDDGARYRLLSAHTCDILIFFRGDGQIIDANPAAVNAYGYPREELLSLSLKDLRSQDTWAEIPAQIQRLESGPFTFESSHQRKDGTRFPVETSWSNAEANGEREILSIVRDITGRKRAEEALRQSEEQFHTLANSIPQLAWVARPDGFITWYNQRWYQYTGTRPEQMAGSDWQLVHDPEMLPQVLERWAASIAIGEPIEMTFPLRGADGVLRPFLTRVMPLKDKQGRVLQWFGTNTDVAELKQAEEISSRLASIVQSSGDAIIGKNLDGIISSWNRGAEQLFGYSEAEALGQPVAMLIPADLQEEAPRILDTLRRGNPIERYETTRRRKDGTPVEVSLTVSPIKNARGETVGASKIARDITARKRLEQELRVTNQKLQSNSEELRIKNEQLAAMTEQLELKNQELEQRVTERTARLQALAGELTQAEERERRRIARILHDGLQQLLIAATIHLEIVRKLGVPQPGLEELRRVAQLIDESNEVARSLSHELSPAALQQGDLPGALKWLAGWMNRNHRLTVRIEAETAAGPLEDSLKVLLFQAVRELLLNVVKHAGVKRAQVRITVTPVGELEILVSDRGKGFDPTRVRIDHETNSGFGLFSIHERLHLLGGRMDVESALECGSRFRLVAPLQQPTPGELLSISPFLVPPGEVRRRPTRTAPSDQTGIHVGLSKDLKLMRDGMRALLGDK